jgi:hypothetical protein
LSDHIDCVRANTVEDVFFWRLAAVRGSDQPQHRKQSLAKGERDNVPSLPEVVLRSV